MMLRSPATQAGRGRSLAGAPLARIGARSPVFVMQRFPATQAALGRSLAGAPLARIGARSPMYVMPQSSGEKASWLA